ncbi:uncharacterized protein LOC113146482 [Cyclospora cayetanensis]|uniref:Uncharacterized protein LOC113146482 n=1 Tax=Cyclospora cayetanensis TaxID=88456 RepID=A0A6P6RPV6_9EIME|nr:uncharacterized protein LOC113146482 [Cyclospora cayetanensis]
MHGTVTPTALATAGARADWTVLHAVPRSSSLQQHLVHQQLPMQCEAEEAQAAKATSATNAGAHVSSSLKRLPDSPCADFSLEINFPDTANATAAEAAENSEAPIASCCCSCFPPPPLLVECLHSSVTAADLRAAFCPFGPLRCVLAPRILSEEVRRNSDGQVAGFSRGGRGRRWSSLGGKGMLWYKDLAASRAAVHAPPQVFRGLPCSLQPSQSFWQKGPLLLQEGGPLMIGHAWRRCGRCSSVAFEAAAAAPAATTAAPQTPAATGDAFALAPKIFLGWRLGDDQQLRIAWAEEGYAILLEYPLRSLASRVFILEDSDIVTDACDTKHSGDSKRGQLLLFCPEHAPRVTVYKTVANDSDSAGSMIRAPDAPEGPRERLVVDSAEEEAASAVAALLLGGEGDLMAPLRCHRWGVGATGRSALQSALLQRLGDCRDLLVQLPPCPAACEGAANSRGEEFWVTELRRHGLLIGTEGGKGMPSRVYITQEPRERERHMCCISEAVLYRDLSRLKDLPFVATLPSSVHQKSSQSKGCSNCPAAAAAASFNTLIDSKSAAALAAPRNAGGSAPPAGSVLTPQEEAPKEETNDAAKAALSSLPSPAAWLLWAEMQQLLSFGGLPPPALFEISYSSLPHIPCTLDIPSEGVSTALLPLAAVLADPQQDANVLREVLKILAEEIMMQQEPIFAFPPCDRLHALLQQKEYVFPLQSHAHFMTWVEASDLI